MRYNPVHKTICGYYRLVESYRNAEDRICHRTILNVGFIEDLVPEQLNIIQKQLTQRAEGKLALFEQTDDALANTYVTKLWNEMVSKKRIELPEQAKEKRKRLVDIDTIKHKDVKEIGAEWLGYQCLEQLELKRFLTSLGWQESQIQLALTQIISRAVYPNSELKTSKWIRDNSAICELTGYPIQKITKDKLYQSSLNLYKIKQELESYLSNKTNELFDIQDKIILYDLTNTYFEGEKQNSKLAKYGRSKEKRSDAKLVVLALVINVEGFIKYSSIFEGNTTDSATLESIIEKLRIQTSATQRALVVLDAGIATEDNLTLLEQNGYDYVCVSRSKLKDYQATTGSVAGQIITKNNQVLTLESVSSATSRDYYLKVKSPGKALKETSMKTQFETRFEQELEKIKVGLSKKHSVKQADKVHQRIGRVIQKYPSTSKYYNIEVSTNEAGLATQMNYTKDEFAHQKKIDDLGIYFIRTNLAPSNEQTLWTIYNTIREIESTFRTLKTDLDLRPIYHKNDDATMAHLHLGLLAYWLVNTIRHPLKQKGIHHNWQEIVRIANTQKMVTTYAKNQDDEMLYTRRCSEPNEAIQKLYNALNFKCYPFVKRKSVVHNSALKKNKSIDLKHFPPD